MGYSFHRILASEWSRYNARLKNPTMGYSLHRNFGVRVGQVQRSVKKSDDGVFFSPQFWRQSVVVGVHRKNPQRWIVQVVQPLLGIEGCAANAALSRQNQ